MLRRWGIGSSGMWIVALAAACSGGAGGKKPPGSPCLGNTDCADTVCHHGVCAAPQPRGFGDPCGSDFACASWRCEGGFCATGTRPAGAACLSAAECASGSCESGTCAGGSKPDAGTDLPPREDARPADGPAHDAVGADTKAQDGPRTDGPRVDGPQPDLALQPDAAPCSGGCVSTVAGTGQIGFVDGPVASATLNNPQAIALDDAKQQLFVLDITGNAAKVRRIDLATRTVYTLVGPASPAAPIAGANNGPATQATFKGPEGLCFGNGKLYVADTGNYLLRQVDPQSGAVSTVAGTAGQSGSSDGPALSVARLRPYDCAIDSTGQVYFADQAGVRVFKPGSPTVATVLQRIGGMLHLELLDDDTAVYPVWHKLFTLKISTKTESGLSVLTASGHNDGLLGTALFHYPQGLAAHGSGASQAIFVADRQNQVLRRIASGSVTTPAGIVGQTQPKALDGKGDQSTFDWPVDVAAAANGDVYVVDSYNNRIRRYRP